MLRHRLKNIDEFVITDPSEARKREKMLPEKWDELFPEQGRRYLDPRSLGCIDPAPPEAIAAFEEVMTEEIREGMVFLGVDPWLKRICMWQKRESLYGDGTVYERAIIFSTQFDPDDLLPADLAWENSDGRYDRYEGCIGEFHVPSVEDFASLKDKVDHWKNSGRELVHTRDWIINKFVGKKMKAWRSEMNRMHDMFRDVYEYSQAAFGRESRQLLGGGQHLAFLPCTSLEQLAREQQENGQSLKMKIPVFDEIGALLYHEIVRRPDGVMNPIFVRRLNLGGTFTTAIASLPAPADRMSVDDLSAWFNDKRRRYTKRLEEVRQEALKIAA